MLNRAGFGKLREDGIMDEKTVVVLDYYQEVHGLYRTGYFDEETMDNLDHEAPFMNPRGSLDDSRRTMEEFEVTTEAGPAGMTLIFRDGEFYGTVFRRSSGTVVVTDRFLREYEIDLTGMATHSIVLAPSSKEAYTAIVTSGRVTYTHTFFVNYGYDILERDRIISYSFRGQPLYEKRLALPSPGFPIHAVLFCLEGDSQASDVLFRLDVKKVQRVLISMGFYDGLPDGILNRDIMEAVRKFQRANSLVDTGLLDDVTLLYMQRERDKSGIASLSE